MEKNERGLQLPAMPSSADGGAMDQVAKIWGSIEAMAANPDLDAAKLGLILDHQIRMREEMARQAYLQAKAQAMAEMPRITKNNRIEHKGQVIGTYAKYDDIRAVIDPILARHGLMLSHRPGFNADLKVPTVECIISFTAGGLNYREECGPMAIPFETSGAKNAAQGSGSTLEYGKRYTTCAALGIVQGIDTDARPAAGGDEMEPWMDALVVNGSKYAAQGAQAYDDWFRGLQNTHRGWLVYKGYHDKWRAEAAQV